MTKKSKKQAPEPEAARDAKALYFLSLDVENVRCFGSKQTLDLSDGNGKPAQWTILLGENGTGKSTLLQCLASIAAEFVSPQGILKRAAVKEHWVRHGDSDYQIPLLYLPGSRFSWHGSQASWTANCALGKSLRSTHSDAFETVSTSVEANSQDQKKIRVPRDVSALPSSIVAGYGPHRQSGETTLRAGDSERLHYRAVNSLCELGNGLVNAEEWLLRRDYAQHRLGQGSKNLVEPVREALIRILPDVDDIRIKALSEDFVQVEFKTPYGWVPLRNLSHGFRSLISWVVDFAAQLFQMFPASENPLAEPAICLVDEIDLHMHPKWQRMLIDYLTERFPNTQFIATAHSPLVVQAAENANIALLKRVEDEVHIINAPQNIRGWRIDQILTSELFGLDTARPPSMEEALRERASILSKSKLTAHDKKRLAALNADMGDRPAGELPEDIEALALIRQAAQRLKRAEK